MKKLLIVIITILMLGVLAIPVAFAESTTQSAILKSDALIEPEILSNLDYYMDLKNPIAMDKTEKYLAVANKDCLFLKNGKNNGKIFMKENFLPEEYVSYDIENLLIIQDSLIIKIKTSGANAIIIGNVMADDIKAFSESIVDTEIKNLVNIAKDKNKFFAISHTNIDSYDINDNKLENKTTLSLSIGTFEAKNIKVFNGNFYVKEDGVAIHHLINDGTTISQDTAIDSISSTITDYLYNSSNQLIYCDNTSIDIHGIKIDKSQYEELKQATFKSLAFDEASKTVLALSSSDDRIYMFDMKGNLNSNYYGSSGNNINRLNSPSDICIFKNEIYIADTENNRIIRQNIETKQQEEIKTANNKPKQIAKTENNLYYITNKNVYSTNSSLAIQDSVLTNAKALAVHKNNLIILNDTTLYEYDGLSLSVIKENLNSDFNKIKIPTNTNNVYLIATENGKIEKYNLEDMQTPTLISNVTIGKNYDIDFIGNLYVQNKNTITKYEQTYKENNAVFNIENAINYQVNIAQNDSIFTYIDCLNGGYYIVNQSKHILSFITAEENNNKLGITCINNLGYDHPIDFDLIQAGTLKEDTKAFASPNNPEANRSVKKNETFLILTKTKDDKYYYVASENNGYYEYIEKKSFNTLFEHDTSIKNADMVALYDNVDVYELPYKNSKKLKDENNAEIKLSPNSYVEGFYKVTKNDVWNWYKIQIYTENGESRQGYVKADYITKKTPTKAPQSILFMKTKAKKIGEKIYIYELASVDSKIISEDVKDGTDIQIIGEFNPESTFTKVLYNNQEGYILTVNLQKSGLTPNQIIAISISCTAIVAFSFIILLFIHKNRKLKKQVDETTVDMLE